MLERIGAVSIIIGTALGVIGLWWLVLRLVWCQFKKTPKKRLKAPLIVLMVSALMTGAPIAVNSLLTRLTSLGPLNNIVNGERHLTLTGWDQHDYSVIAQYRDTIVLQMANVDVTDDTLKYLASLKQLRELDLNGSQVTDAGLAKIAQLPKLQDVRLARTKITDEGFREHLFGKESLMNLDLTATLVASKSVREWKAAKSDRKVLK